MLDGLSPSDAISIIAGILSAFLMLVGIIVTLYKWNIEKTITSQSELINQKIDLTHEMIKTSMESMKENTQEVREIAIAAHQEVNAHVLNYHRGKG